MRTTVHHDALNPPGAPSGKNGTVAYGLDPVGNRTAVSSGISGLSPVAGSFNQDDELSAESYDQNGNVTATGGKSFAYNSQNQLISMGATVSIVYDGDGNRVAKTVSGVTTRYLVDDLNPTGYPQVMDELTNGAVSRTYTYGLQRIDEDQIISSAWTPSFYGYDGFGSVRQLTNVAGTVTDTYDYDAFGNKINSTGTTPNNFLYRGEFFDSDLGLYYLRARYYNPAVGRFLSEDPLGFLGGINHYAYAGNDPIDFIDPFGTDKREGCAAEAAKKEGLAFAIDVLGAFPVEGQILSIAQLTAGGVGFINSLLQQDATSAVGSIVGDQTVLVGMAAKSLGVTSLKVVPVLGNLLSAGLAVRDIVHAVEDYHSCMGGNW